ncbi:MULTISPECIES: hypothetical protein [unclassified Escherichia]|uniref:hypothetical protein n=1 Tax=unclassified Escherichia TaxID=2608889 RepID=UPI00102A3D4A|nr:MULTISPECIES: hypothetical protein [unclassified Escherichia]RZN44845.1 hypothetical protein D9597_20975 [Escherichia sp. E13S3]TGC00557.1 hypothetical protein CRI63_19180 [Escherichia sp. E2661]
MNIITDVLVNGHMFNCIEDMQEKHFPTTLFPEAYFQMVIDGDVKNNRNVIWRCREDLSGNPVSVNQDGVVKFNNADESFVGHTFYIEAIDKNTSRISVYSFTIEKFFKHNTEKKLNPEETKLWVASVNGQLPHVVELQDNVMTPAYRQVNGGLFKEWGKLVIYGWISAYSDTDIAATHGFDNGKAYCCDGGSSCFSEIGHLDLNACAVFK